MSDWLTTPASETVSRLLVVAAYAAITIGAAAAAHRLQPIDGIRAMLIWLAVASAAWAVWFVALIVTGTALSHWTAHGFRLLLLVTWPPLSIAFLRWAHRWTVELHKVTRR